MKQREDDSQCSKMMLRFREDKIKRLESVANGFLSADAFLVQEKNALVEELQLVQGRLDRHPELTRFAMENIRLLEQLRRYRNLDLFNALYHSCPSFLSNDVAGSKEI